MVQKIGSNSTLTSININGMNQFKIVFLFSHYIDYISKGEAIAMATILASNTSLTSINVKGVKNELKSIFLRFG